MRRTIAFVLVCVLAGVTPADTQHDASTQQFLHRAVELVLANAYFADRLSRDEIDAIVAEALRSASEPKDTYDDVQRLLDLLGDGHSHIEVHGNDERPFASTARLRPPFPSSDDLGGLGYLRLSPFVAKSNDGTEAYEYVARAWSTIERSAGACGWVVDLRHNVGGLLVPMIAAVAPLLGVGRATGFTTRDGSTHWLSVQPTGITYDDEYVFTFDRTTTVADASPLFVLVDDLTASSAEAVALALRENGGQLVGRATLGLTTANTAFSVTDGVVLVLATAVLTDNSGTLHAEALKPDTGAETASPTGDDPAVAAAARAAQDRVGCGTRNA